MALMSLDPDREGPQAVDHALEDLLNAFQIAFEGCLTPSNN